MGRTRPATAADNKALLDRIEPAPEPEPGLGFQEISERENIGPGKGDKSWKRRIALVLPKHT
jgi:hypothetical protein